MTASLQAQAFWNMIRSAPKQIDLPLAQRRAVGEHAEDSTAEPAGVQSVAVQQVDGLRVSVAGPVCDILYLFGGGYVLGSPHSRRKTAGHLANAAQASVIVPNYRLAPEHTFPAALDDVLAAYKLLVAEPAERPAFIVGDSAGGGLALALGLAIRDHKLRPPAGIVALSPWADLSCSGQSFASRASRDIECTKTGLLDMAKVYVGTADPRSPYVSPAFGTFDDFPPVLCVVGSEEVLLDDTLRVVGAIADAGGSATAMVVAGMQHVFPIWVGVFPEAGLAMEAIGSWLLKTISVISGDEIGGAKSAVRLP